MVMVTFPPPFVLPPSHHLFSLDGAKRHPHPLMDATLGRTSVVVIYGRVSGIIVIQLFSVFDMESKLVSINELMRMNKSALLTSQLNLEVLYL